MDDALTEPGSVKGCHVDGRPPELVELQGGQGLQIICMDIGATWLSCRVPTGDQKREVLLGHEHLSSYLNSGACMGATVGRYANRIANGRFQGDNGIVQLATNEGGNTLHGGPEGFHRRRWRIAEVSGSSVSFELHSPDGDQGFPGNLTASVQYSISGDAVEIRFRAETDRQTAINLCNHAYFNLADAAGQSDCGSHSLSIAADHYLPVDQAGLPRDGLMLVEGTDFDFRRDRIVGKQGRGQSGYDHSWLLDREAGSMASPGCVLKAPDRSLTLEVLTDKPALQVYTGEGLRGLPARGGGTFEARAGLALETQFLPDSPNHPEWPQRTCLYGPAEDYRFTTVYRFTVPA